MKDTGSQFVFRVDFHAASKFDLLEILSYTTRKDNPYRGMTRIIGAATIREALEVLQMYDQFPSYRTFFEGTDPRYMLIAQFEGPLRRLKDK